MKNEVKYLLTIKHKTKEPNTIPITLWDKHTVTNINDLIQIRYSTKTNTVTFYTIFPSNTTDIFDVELDKKFAEDDLNNTNFTGTIIINDELYIFERQGEI